MTRYELLDRIGVGGMAEIFRGKAVAAGGFEKPVAIKRILPHLSQDKRFVELLIAEAKVLSLLKHRNIVQIFDVGLGDDGKYFLVMEYVDGKDLGAIQQGLEARRARIPLDLALHVGAEICEALEHAHTAKAPDGKPMTLVHRDVSPSNVLVSRAGEVKLTDFGIAKRAEQETQHGAVRGKFAYISPEQARNEHLDPRSDVFSVGILLWELLTNRRLFSGLGDLEALRAVREAQVPRPREIVPDIPADVDKLLMTVLARDPRGRPSAGQLAAKLRSIRYALDETVGDPATELAKIIDAADQVQRESRRMAAPQLPGMYAGFDQHDHTEATVIRIRTADDFSMPDKRAGMAKARSVIAAFEEEETRLAQLSGEQLAKLRERRDSGEVVPPPRLPGVDPAPRPRRPTDEPTTAHRPLDPMDHLSSPSFDIDESTRLVVPSRDRPPGARPAPGLPPPPAPPSAGRAAPPPLQPVRPPPQPVQPPTSSSAYAGSGGPPMPQPMPPPPQGYVAPFTQPAWGGVAPQLPPRAASPTAPEVPERPDLFARPGYPPPPPPQVAGFQPRKQFLQPWMLVVGALLMAALAFAITRMLLS